MSEGRPEPSPEVDSTEILARYCVLKDQIKGARATRRLFLPNRDGEMSVFRIDALDETEIWDLARRFVDSNSHPVVARAEVTAQAVMDVGLRVNPDADPHPRHANVVDWPEGKDDVSQRAQLIASSARACWRPVSSPT